MHSIVPIILAGGAGSRLWPLSRGEYPKQLLRLGGDHSLLQVTAKRAGRVAELDSIDCEPPLVLCSEELRFLVSEQLEEIGHSPQGVVLEPVGRNTAPALTAAAHWLTAQGKDPLMLVMPADHVVNDEQSFLDMVAAGIEGTRSGAMVTFGITPSAPETGYGYIQLGASRGRPGAGIHDVARFVEKPDHETAQRYLADGNHLWNAGIFLMGASVWLAAIKELRPDIEQAALRSVEQSSRDLHFTRLHRRAFECCPAESIDYAVMEPLSARDDALLVVKADIGWSDLGSWSAIYDIGAADSMGNVVQGDSYAMDTRNSLLISDDRFLATLGVSNLIVVSTPDALLVADRAHVQDVRAVVDHLNASGRDESRTHRRVYRPWGSYEALDSGERYQVKRLSVKPGARLSLQMHHHRAEHWTVVRGTARVTRGSEEFLLGENESTYIPLGTVHRLENPGRLELEVIEVQSGSYLGEDDIVRIEDQYNRVAGDEPVADK